jgi:hypothetical protein
MPRARLDMARVATAAGSEIRHFVMAITSVAGTTNNVGDLRMSFALTNWSPAALIAAAAGGFHHASRPESFYSFPLLVVWAHIPCT